MSIPPSSVRRLLRHFAASEPLRLRISGVCMEPAIPDGALVTIARKRLYWPGDVLVFSADDGRLTAHRLVGACRCRGRFRLFTRADNAPKLDRAILPCDVVGHVVGGESRSLVTRIPFARRLDAFGFFLRCGFMRLFTHKSQP